MRIELLWSSISTSHLEIQRSRDVQSLDSGTATLLKASVFPAVLHLLDIGLHVPEALLSCKRILAAKNPSGLVDTAWTCFPGGMCYDMI